MAGFVIARWLYRFFPFLPRQDDDGRWSILSEADGWLSQAHTISNRLESDV